MKRLLALVLGVGLLFGGASLALATETQECVPQDGWTEVIEHPGQHYSYTGGPIAGTPATVPPSDEWQANTEQEPPGHLITANAPGGGAYTVPPGGLHYVSHGSSGLADWFYFAPGWTETIVHPPVTCPKPPPTHTPPPHPTPPPTTPPPTVVPEPEPTCHDTGTCFTPDKPPRCERPGNEDVKACQPKTHQPPAELAFTGLDSTLWFAIGFLLSLLAGLAALALGQSVRRGDS